MSRPSGQKGPSRRQKLKPFEYVAFAGVAGIFTLLVVLMSVRDLTTAAIFGGIAFIVTLVGTATLMLAVGPEKSDPGSQK